MNRFSVSLSLLFLEKVLAFKFHLRYSINLGVFFLRHIIQYGSKIIHSNRCFFLPDVCQLRSRCSFTFLNVNFFHQIVANLPYNSTGIVNLLKTFKKLGFLGKVDALFRKNPNVFKIAKCGHFFVECVSNVIIS